MHVHERERVGGEKESELLGYSNYKDKATARTYQ